jgi:predicted Rossmann fold flavoprotein
MHTTGKKRLQEFFAPQKKYFRPAPQAPRRSKRPSSRVSDDSPFLCYTQAAMSAVAVIGGGPSGIMAAIAAAKGGEAAVVFDRAAPLATILRTGGGRCNLSNAAADLGQLAAAYPRGGKFLLSVFSRFGVPETLEWFRSRGLPLAVEEEGRVFPASGRAGDVRDLLLREARRVGVTLRGGTVVRRIERTAEGFGLTTGGPASRSASAASFSAVILAAGGDWRNPPGCGYRLAASLGHSITPLAPSLTGLRVSESWPRGLAGLTLTCIRAQAFFQGRKVADERGDLLFTHRGISGPLAFRVSARSAFLPYSPQAPLALTLSLVPDLRPARVEEEIQSAMNAHPRQAVATALGRYAPRSLNLALLALAEIDAAKNCSQLSRTERNRIAALLCGVPLSVTGRENETAMVCAGGVALEEVTPSTMESRIVPGLFFCGEVLDIDGFTGGFNLQAAWSTGWLSGLGAASAVSRALES